MQRECAGLAGVLVLSLGFVSGFADKAATGRAAVAFKHEPNVLHINVGGQPFADYIYFTEDITRPYFAHVKTPAGIQVTRNRPPGVKDLQDHPTMHPGIWISFGDLSGNDYWRLKAKVEHEMFIEPPKGGEAEGRFAVRNYYWNKDNTERIASEEARYRILSSAHGYLLVWESTFAPYGETEKIVFGDQEELGLGIRVQTQLAEQFGGMITDSTGRKGAREIWSKQADWIDYSGMLEGKWIGMTIMPGPDNFRKSWWHARDYGFIAANPFGREAMKAGPRSEVVVGKGEKLTLSYGILIHSSDTAQGVDLSEACKWFLRLLQEGRR